MYLISVFQWMSKRMWLLTVSLRWNDVLSNDTYSKTGQLCHISMSAVISHHIASHRTAPHRTAPHRTAPHRTAPHRTAPHRTAPHRTASHRIASHHITSHHTTPHHITSHVDVSLRVDHPTRPGRPHVTKVSDREAYMIWEEPESDGNSYITSYRVDWHRPGECTLTMWGDSDQVNGHCPSKTNTAQVGGGPRSRRTGRYRDSCTGRCCSGRADWPKKPRRWVSVGTRCALSVRATYGVHKPKRVVVVHSYVNLWSQWDQSCLFTKQLLTPKAQMKGSVFPLLRTTLQ